VATGWVSDEVWAQLDPRAGRLTRSGRLALTVSAVAAIALIVGIWAAGVSGVVRPRLSATGWSATTGPVTVVETVTAANTGWTTARLTSVATPTAGLRIEGVRGLPVHVRSGASARIIVRIAVTDCANPPSGWIPLQVRASHWWGTTSAALAEPSGGGPPLAAEACHATE
jgi:hypothetical protein